MDTLSLTIGGESRTLTGGDRLEPPYQADDLYLPEYSVPVYSPTRWTEIPEYALTGDTSPGSELADLTLVTDRLDRWLAISHWYGHTLTAAALLNWSGSLLVEIAHGEYQEIMITPDRPPLTSSTYHRLAVPLVHARDTDRESEARGETHRTELETTITR